MLHSIKFIILSLFFSMVMACASSPTQESAGEYLDSAAVTAKVKTNLVDQLGSQGFSIQVKTYKDEVQLSGFVNNAVIKQRAGVIAANTLDVKRVSNHLIVKTS